MPALFIPARPLIFLPCMIVCASCASLAETCVQCSLSCDGAPELKRHESVIVSINPPLQKDSDKVFSVSSLFDKGHCSVPGCFQRDTQYALEIYSNDDRVSKILLNKPNLNPDCGPEAISDKNNPDGADGKLYNMFLILLALCFWIVFH